MAITDIQISEELETNAPSIKYRGSEGPRSPQEEQQMMADAILQEEYEKYVYDLLETRPEATPMSFEEFRQMVLAEGQMSGGQPLPQDPTKPVNPFQPKPIGPLPDKMMAGTDTPEIEIELLQELLEAFREKFKRDPVSIDELKKAIGQMREKAAYGGIMGIDGRRKYGLGSSLKKFARKIIPNEVAEIAVKAAPFVAPFNPLAAAAMSGLGSFDQTGRIGSSLRSGLMNYALGQGARYLGGADFQGLQNPFTRDAFSMPTGSGGIKELFKSKQPADISRLETVSDAQKASQLGSIPKFSLATGDAAAAEFSAASNPIIKAQQEAFKIADLPGLVKKNLMAAGLGNNLMTGLLVGGLGAGALMGNMTEDEIQDMDRGEGLDIEGIRQEVITAMKDPTGEALKAIRVKYPFLGRRDTKDLSSLAMGGRIRRAEGGLMDLGGMEKDYRNTGGFVDLGAREKADDVPARLSVNEFVFTADAVRNAGGGDIDKGAEVMENVMKHLEQGGQMSEESQGMQGAQRMFEVSERLSEVI
tara:strand:- start:19 stop:1611 length:1593 start_codon:yes stop_codon:yes gene_type:complete